MPNEKDNLLDDDDLLEGKEDTLPALGDIEDGLDSEEEDAVEKEAVRMTADVPVQVVAVLGKKTISVKDLIGLRIGQVIDLARPVNEAVDLVAGGKLIGKGELVDIDGKLGVRIIKMVRE